MTINTDPDNSHFPGASGDVVRSIAGKPPLLIVCIDVEEEFDWTKPFSRTGWGVSSINSLRLAQEIFDRCGITPTFLVDHPIANDERAVEVIGDIHAAGRCVIGSQLHPWVTPPFDEELSVRNSFPGNLPGEIEQRKLETLTHLIEHNFEVRPTIYKAGRSGVGGKTADILARLNYEIDMSVQSHRDFRVQMGPDFRNIEPAPYWFESNGISMLEIPLTCSCYGALTAKSLRMLEFLDQPLFTRFHMQGILARLGLLNRVTLTPEGVLLREAQRLTRALIADGLKVFTLSFHSPSLEPGNTQYVRDKRDLQELLFWLEAYFQFFKEEFNGEFVTPGEFYSMARGAGNA